MDLEKLKSVDPATVAKVLSLLADAVHADTTLLPDLVDLAQGKAKPIDVIKRHPALAFKLLMELGAGGLEQLVGAL